MTGPWVLRHDERPFTANQQVRKGRYQHGREVREWREAFAWLAKEARVPKLRAVEVVVDQECWGGPLADVCACAPAVKAALDGIVDAGCLPDDGPAFVWSVTYNAPTRSERKTNSLTLTLVAAGPAGERTT